MTFLGFKGSWALIFICELHLGSHSLEEISLPSYISSYFPPPPPATTGLLTTISMRGCNCTVELSDGIDMKTIVTSFMVLLTEANTGLRYYSPYCKEIKVKLLVQDSRKIIVHTSIKNNNFDMKLSSKTNNLKKCQCV